MDADEIAFMDASDDDEPPMLVDLNPPPTPELDDAFDESLEELHPALPPCPVTILSGFLGSGKVCVCVL